MTWSAPVYPNLRPGIVLVVAMVVAAGCATSDSPLRNTVESPIAPFGDLFASPDTIRLDSEAIIGSIDFLDVSQEGQLLIADEISKNAHHFSASGKHIQTYLIGTCQPDHADDRVNFARFIDGGKVMLLGGSGSVAVFDQSGGCAATEFRQPIGLEGACEIGDSVLMQPTYTPYHKPEVYAVTRDLEKLEEWQIEEPDFPQLNGYYKGFRGRSMACFADGPYYKYAEWSDALPVFSRDSVAQVDPVFFTKRVQDIRRRDEVKEYPTNSGILAIDSTTRMIVYSKLPIEWRLPDVLLQTGIAVVSNVGAFPARAAVVPFYPIGAANGYVYHQADYEILPDGDFGNPLILRYKFVPPPDANP
ncbi:MAG: hypothetical protein F4246_05700 [Rhodothermaceae bacterium]|nr:hypothetical protein [Rhodothermaceae bacterium]MXX59798.1 hypothetical protein [Rhodothermaceae bacterium]MYD20211.1 hypothetical protein [Rhodothermaceae bacterium]MYD56490.1 hypothetical protein [Rhodothermaceae bacterium]MYJ57025.1 hypothetical protein [Rhodothermaceae bacterium]